MDRRTAATAFAAATLTALVAASGRPAEARTSVAVRPCFVDTEDGPSLSYVDWGAGKPVLFTHPWPYTDIWEYQLIELADQGLRCVAYDRRGHGRSTDPGRNSGGLSGDDRVDPRPVHAGLAEGHDRLPARHHAPRLPG
jgi:hypothetical protein